MSFDFRAINTPGIVLSPGDGLELHFHADGKKYLRLLLIMINKRWLVVERSSRQQLQLLGVPAAWRYPCNRRLKVVVTEHFDQVIFEKLMQDALEKLRYISANKIDGNGRQTVAQSAPKATRARTTRAVDLRKVDALLQCGIKWSELAKIVGTDRQTIGAWHKRFRQGEAEYTTRLESAAEAMEQLHAIVTALLESGMAMEPGRIPRWLNSRNGYLRSRRPADVFVKDGPAAVMSAVEQYRLQVAA